MFDPSTHRGAETRLVQDEKQEDEDGDPPAEE